jgi:hypothetical protein
MAFVVLGEKARENFGLREKYSSSLRSEYKTYIDSIEYDMMAKVYSSTVSDCIVTKSFDLLLTQQQIDDCVGEEKYTELETAVINFCQIHQSHITIQRTDTTIEITVDMKLPFSISYVT